MPKTFQELQQQLANARHRRTILLNLVEYIDVNFLPVGGSEPKMKLLDEERKPVPVEVFEAVASDTLSAEVQQLDQVINEILGANLSTPEPPPPEPTPAPPPPAPTARPRRASRSTQETT
jgi:hypothetical protein